ncbi:hypothetical protein C9374_012915 [Naegleria lovaniensis]|uniref:HAMP domain-containing protein n=1 Tax=Naegleria lovaniensis TaxID=51637 RepID=A0AA88KDM6_NAELO|nr:uncharacterized protein C9374_012915 [Naegleria lovaniensis]KAG2373069.1 hypothetical protein C9374_012915 [Naegleria lovaniensis]
MKLTRSRNSSVLEDSAFLHGPFELTAHLQQQQQQLILKPHVIKLRKHSIKHAHEKVDMNNYSQTAPSTSANPNNNSNSSSVQLVKSLRFKTLTVLILLFILLMALCLATLLTAFNLSFQQVENSMALESAKRSTRAFFDDFSYLNSRVFEYAAFGDTVNVVLNTTNNAPMAAEAYLNYYLHCQYQLSTKVNFALIYYLNGTLLKGLGCFRGLKLDKIPQELLSLDTIVGRPLKKNIENPATRNVGFFSPSEKLLDLVTNSETSAILAKNFSITPSSDVSNVLLLSAMPIQDTDYKKSYGLLVFGRYEFIDYVYDMSDRTQLCLTLYNLDILKDRQTFAASLANDFSNFTELTYYGKDLTTLSNYISKSTRNWQPTIINGIYSQSNWGNNSGQFVQQISVPTDFDDTIPILKNRQCADSDSVVGERMAVFQLFNDITGKSNLVIRTDFPRDIFTLGITSFVITWAVMTFMIILLSVSVIIFLEYFVIRRVIRLTNSVRSITNNNDIKQRVPNSGSDELGMLSDDVNDMLTALDNSQSVLTEDNLLMQRLLEKTSLSEQQSRVIMNGIEDFIIVANCKNGSIISFNTIFESKILKKNLTNIMDYFITESRHSVSTDTLNIYDSSETSITTNSATAKVDDFLSKLDQLAQSKTRWEIHLKSSLNIEIPVSVSASHVNMMLEEGKINDVFVIVARNLSEQQELRQAVKHHQQQMQQFKQNLEFERVMFHPVLKEKFKAFCEKECSEENFSFLEDVAAYKTTKKTADRSKKQSEIIQKYLLDSSPTPINISQKVKETEVTKISNGYAQIDLFDNIERVVKAMMLKDTFMRFSLQNDIALVETSSASSDSGTTLSILSSSTVSNASTSVL